MDRDSETLVVIQTYDSPSLAEIAKSVLDDAGIYCALHGEYMSSIYSVGLFPVRLVVMAKDEDTARQLLNIE